MAERKTGQNTGKVPELLAPAGSLDSLRAAVNAGADAVYIGGRKFGARAYAENPEEDLLREGIRRADRKGRLGPRKLYTEDTEDTGDYEEYE